MSKDISKEATAYILWMNIAQFLQQSTSSNEAYMESLDKLLVGIEEISEKILGPLFKEDKEKSTAEIVAKLKEINWAKITKKSKGIDKKKKAPKKSRTIKKK